MSKGATHQDVLATKSTPTTDFTNLDEVKHDELQYEQQLILELLPTAARQRVGTPAAQFVFCIDVRSEPLRRNLETLGDYETFGFAGFFGVAARIEAGPVVRDQCPALISPSMTARRRPPHSRTRLGDALFAIKGSAPACFAFVEVVGVFSAVAMLVQQWAPQKWRALRRRWDGGVPEASLDVPLDDVTAMVANMLKAIGLVDDFAPVVALVGHGSTVANNAFESKLDCGACGANRGIDNAALMAALCNRADVRAALPEFGIVIPEETTFVGAEHDTGTGTVSLSTGSGATGLRSANVGSTFWDNLVRDVNQAASAAARERLAVTGDALADALKRSALWSETRPEAGLAGNAAFVIGSRALTTGLHLQGRTFLHSYDYRLDGDGGVLAAILQAPVVVAEGINLQYLFSALQPDHLGAGDKTTHNVVGVDAVMQGALSDLGTGLPLQAVTRPDGSPLHTPQRLLVVVQAPRTLAQNVVEQCAVVDGLLIQGWMKLMVIDPDDAAAYRYERDGSWSKIEDRVAVAV